MSDHDNEEDPRRLFEQAMQGVQPIKSKKRHDQQRKPSADIPESTMHTRRSAAQRTESGGGAALSEAWVEPVDPEQRIDFSRPGLQQTRLRQLRQGMIPVRYQLDLHGYKIEEARELISEFLYFCKTQSFACVRIIHGKSHRRTDRQNTLKSHVNHWLRQIPDVLAFCSAPPSEGGTGSVLVLIRKK
ncbi:Smr/MutS family protein [Endozoicomonas euniceicola]|uniref:Smr/MutS family endonuclease n=1 Tax=Endozoicomonas euniceicola TaxID=1234143 RepID=A0ABY6GUL1_9GAMM|nr:Smr/MutS family endonuclease [Endozoicomonas euniceicola]UYM16465.1 Smr/MutS family endonuclease [Endozoicomonas euniceicola]